MANILFLDNFDSFTYNLVDQFRVLGHNVKIYRNDTNLEQVVQEALNTPDTILALSPGPGTPAEAGILLPLIERLKNDVPIIGICLGHQLLSNAFGYETYKLKFGQHGSNHPVQNLQTNTVEITSQNHNYNVPESIAEIATITHRNLFDGTIEGVRYKDAPIFSVQYHPESSAGPHESEYLFKEFLEILSDKTQNQNVE